MAVVVADSTGISTTGSVEVASVSGTDAGVWSTTSTSRVASARTVAPFLMRYTMMCLPATDVSSETLETSVPS